MKNLQTFEEFVNESLNESASIVMSLELGGYDDKQFLKTIWKLSIEELNSLLEKAQSDLKWLNGNSKGILGSFNRKDAQFTKSRITWIKDVIKHKQNDPEFIPDWLK